MQKYPTLPHVSLYELTVERGTPLEKDVRKGRIIMPSEETRACLYEDTVEVLKEYGFQRYEVSNFSKGEEHRGRHNSRYWQGGNYLGLGEYNVLSAILNLKLWLNRKFRLLLQ